MFTCFFLFWPLLAATVLRYQTLNLLPQNSRTKDRTVRSTVLEGGLEPILPKARVTLTVKSPVLCGPCRVLLVLLVGKRV